jgi:hypothetical protein
VVLGYIDLASILLAMSCQNSLSRRARRLQAVSIRRKDRLLAALEDLFNDGPGRPFVIVGISFGEGFGLSSKQTIH